MRSDILIEDLARLDLILGTTSGIRKTIVWKSIPDYSSGRAV
jgi:hypothetical protein